MKQNKAKELLADAIARLGTLRAVCDNTGLNKSTLMHIQNGDTARPHPKTLGLLTIAAYGE